MNKTTKTKPEPRTPFSATGKPNPLPAFPYGAVYFRKTNPPRADWERDYQTAAADGMNAFRHWFIWAAIEVAPETYDWSDYDRQLELGAANGIKAIIAELGTLAPEWVMRRFPSARAERRNGSQGGSDVSVSCAVGGVTGMCLDHDDYHAAAENFLRNLAERYKDHPGLGGYDIWNECNQAPCYCSATTAKFHEWLKEKYGDLKKLGEVWHRYSYAEWEDVLPPRHEGAYPDVLDWHQFCVDNAYAQMRWRFNVIRSVDSSHPIFAHGVAGSFTWMAQQAADDWRAAAEVEGYGCTWGSCRHGDEPWKQFHALDMVRASAMGKPFWHAEAYAGPLWMAANVLNKPRDEGRIASPEDVRYWSMVSFMAGARGLFYLRWRPLLDGPLFGAFGPYGMDGSRTPRSEMVAEIGKWCQAPEQDRLWLSRPVKGDIGIIYIPETELFAYAQQGDTTYYHQSMQGAYQGFFDANIQADWVNIEDIDAYDLLYLPYPLMLPREASEKLVAWVAAGGVLVSEGCPGYFGDGGHVGQVQPNLGLDVVFGARESYVEFTPDLLVDLIFDCDGHSVRGGLFMQSYDLMGGTSMGFYADGRVAVVDHTYGKGRTRLIGTMCGAGYAAHPGQRSPAFFSQVLALAGKEQHVYSSEPRVKARLQTGEGGTYLWIANPTRQTLPVQLTLGEVCGQFSTGRTLWGAESAVAGRKITLDAPARDVTIISLD